MQLNHILNKWYLFFFAWEFLPGEKNFCLDIITVTMYDNARNIIIMEKKVAILHWAKPIVRLSGQRQRVMKNYEKPIRKGHTFWINNELFFFCSYTAKPPDIIAVYLTKAYSPRQFRQFELELRANLHDTLHCNVGGTMCNQYSANAPEFFLHHAFIDKIWADWQEKGTEHMDVYFRDLPSRTRMQAAQFHPQDYIDTLYLPHPDVNRRNAENICVIYKDPVHPMYDEVMSRLESLTTREVRQIRRRAFRPATSRQLRRLGVKRKERRQARRLLRMIEPGRQHRILTKSLKTTLDKMLGFSLKSIPFRANSIRDRPARSSVLRDARWLANSLNSTKISIGNFGDSASANISSTLV